MKKILFLMLVTCLTTISVKAQISSFNIADRKAFVYLGWTPGYDDINAPFNVYDFARQKSDWLEVAVHYPIWKGLNINAGLSMNLNFQSIEDMGLISNEDGFIIDNSGSYRYATYIYKEGERQIRGSVINAGLSYTLGKGAFQVIPAFGLSLGQEWDLQGWYNQGLENFVYEGDSRTSVNPYISLDLAYKNFLLGFQTTLVAKENKDFYALRVGYGFPLNSKSKMKF
jgi:hypothetical protein